MLNNIPYVVFSSCLCYTILGYFLLLTVYLPFPLACVEHEVSKKRWSMGARLWALFLDVKNEGDGEKGVRTREKERKQVLYLSINHNEDKERERGRGKEDEDKRVVGRCSERR